MQAEQMRVGRRRHGFIAVNVTEQVIRVPRVCLPVRARVHTYGCRAGPWIENAPNGTTKCEKQLLPPFHHFKP